MQITCKANKFLIQKDTLGTATVQVDSGIHKEAIKAMMNADQKAALTAITGLDLGTDIGILYHVRLT